MKGAASWLEIARFDPCADNGYGKRRSALTGQSAHLRAVAV